MRPVKIKTRAKSRYKRVLRINKIKAILNNILGIEFKISKKHIKELSYD